MDERFDQVEYLEGLVKAIQKREPVIGLPGKRLRIRLQLLGFAINLFLGSKNKRNIRFKWITLMCAP